MPDPASRQQAEDVHGPSVVVDPRSYPWRTGNWRGRPWHEAVLYELHVGAFSASGDFDGVLHKLDWLERLGVTAIELMPIADFAGRRNWGYDGVLPFAPDRAYGASDSLKALIDAAHERGLMMFLDVVYNHFGPEGNYLGRYAPQFFTDRHQTPWGSAIDYTRPVVRDFFIHNALYWLEEFRFDGLRLDAVHAIADDSSTHILTELAHRVRGACGPDRHVHLVLENDANQVKLLGRPHYDAQWNDDFHHASHVVLTREAEGYYVDYQRDPLQALGRALAEGFVFQGETSLHRDGAARGEPTRDLPLDAFVAFLQNHDQVGNRAFGERLAQLVRPELLKAAASILLLSPQVPLLFMGEEWASAKPFQFFCDFGGELAQAVRDGRRREFAKFPAFADPGVRDRIPDPNDVATFERSKLDWAEADRDSHADHVTVLSRAAGGAPACNHSASRRHPCQGRALPGDQCRPAAGLLAAGGWRAADAGREPAQRYRAGRCRRIGRRLAPQHASARCGDRHETGVVRGMVSGRAEGETVSESGSLDQLCDSLGISTRYRDHMGVVRQVPEQTLRSLLKSLKSAAPEGVLPPVIVHRQGGGEIAVAVRHDGEALRWTLDSDEGSARSGWVDPAIRQIVIAGTVAQGQYLLKVYCGDIVAAPAR